jgi:hypothetical protein
MLGAVSAPAMAVAATARPAVPSLTPTSSARAGSTLAGRNSLATSIAIPNESATTGVQVGLPGGVAAGPPAGEPGSAGEPDGVLLSEVLWVGMPPAWARRARGS